MPRSLSRVLSPASEIVVSTTENRRDVHRRERKGELRRLAPKLYTPNLTDAPEKIVRRNLWQICSAFFPDGLIADRTALEHSPATDGSVFLVSRRTSDLHVPGVVFRPRPGVPPIGETDSKFIGSLWMSSQARALLENMRPSRSRSTVRRTLSREELEIWLDTFIRKAGQASLNRLRSQFKTLAGPLGLVNEANELDRIIGALLGTRDAKLLTDAGKSRARGMGYDPERLELFEKLRVDLATHSFQDRASRSDETFLPFFEAYFSNFIEGTEFLVKDAHDIVYKGMTPKDRPDDAHDILDTFRVVADAGEMRQAPHDPEEFIELLLHRHSVILSGRPTKAPGEFKTLGNRAGSSIFVEPDLVSGTLHRGFEIMNTLAHPMARALFAMFLVAEVHPFADGNGRVARIMMNAELASRDQSRIIIPTVFRTEYMQSLKRLTADHYSAAFISVMDLAQSYVSQIDFSDYDQAEQLLNRTNAFKSPADAIGYSAGLILPSSLRT